MSVILLVLGILLSAAGGASIGFGIPIKELSHGPTLILGGVFALVGGLLLIGLSAVVAELARVTAALTKARQIQPAAPERAAPVPERAARAELPAPPTETVAREPATTDVPREPAKSIQVPPAAAPAPPSPTVEVSATALERLRNMPRPDKVVPEAAEAVPLSPNGQQAAHHVEPPQPEPLPRSAGAEAVEAGEPRLDFLFRPRQVRQGSPQEPFDALWPKRPAREGQSDPRLEVARAPVANGAAPVAAPTSEVAAAPSPAPQQRTVAILKSGVVDGMAYTLYADGSIEAQLPQGTVRFGSIAELRAHIESNA
jgi:hypothetical protein